MTIILTDDQAEKVREALNVAVAVLYKVAYEESKIGIEAECAGSFVPEALAILDGAQRVEVTAWMRSDKDLLHKDWKRSDYAYTHYYDTPLYAIKKETP